jgi:signal transduction histidine kinase
MVEGALGVGFDVTERTRAQRDSEQARLAAERLVRARSDFLMATNHELRTPLTSILGYAELLQANWSQVSEQRRRNYVNLIMAAAQRLAQLVESLGLLNELDAGLAICSGEHFVLESVVRAAVDEIAAIYPAQETNLDGPPGIRVVADQAHVVEVLASLLDNAAKHSPAGAAIDVTWSAEGTMAAVRDHGLGLPEGGRERLFTRFWRLPGSGMRDGRVGTGLGLHIARRLAELMGGSVDLEATGPEGSTFRLDLPLLTTDQ